MIGLTSEATFLRVCRASLARGILARCTYEKTRGSCSAMFLGVLSTRVFVYKASLSRFLDIAVWMIRSVID